MQGTALHARTQTTTTTTTTYELSTVLSLSKSSSLYASPASRAANAASRRFCRAAFAFRFFFSARKRAFSVNPRSFSACSMSALRLRRFLSNSFASNF